MGWPSWATKLKQVCQHRVIRCRNVWVWFGLHLKGSTLLMLSNLDVKCIHWFSNHFDWLQTCRESSSTRMLNIVSFLFCSIWDKRHIVCWKSIYKAAWEQLHDKALCCKLDRITLSCWWSALFWPSGFIALTIFRIITWIQSGWAGCCTRCTVMDNVEGNAKFTVKQHLFDLKTQSFKHSWHLSWMLSHFHFFPLKPAKSARWSNLFFK